MKNVLTFDLEEYFQVSGFEDVVRREDWPHFPSRVAGQAERLLALLGEHGVRATFFVLGATAERHPDLVSELLAQGHEVASHGYEHRLLYRHGPRAFRRDLRRGLAVLEGLSGVPIYGYRAPSFSVVERTLWALPILAEEGLLYDSSIVPIRHDRYGIPGARRTPYEVEVDVDRSICELPPLTRKLLGMNFAAGGGGWFRLLPLSWTKAAVRTMNRAGQPAVIYLHPWELDPGQPDIRGARRTARFRHRVGLTKTEGKLRRLLDRFDFTTAAEWLGLPEQTSMAAARDRTA